MEEEGPNLLLFLGLGLVAIGLIITFVGVGEKGFWSVDASQMYDWRNWTAARPRPTTGVIHRPASFLYELYR